MGGTYVFEKWDPSPISNTFCDCKEEQWVWKVKTSKATYMLLSSLHSNFNLLAQFELEMGEEQFFFKTKKGETRLISPITLIYLGG